MPDFFEAILSNGNRTALEWDHKNWVHNGIYCLLWKKVRLHFIKMSALWCSILRQMLYIVDKAPIKSHSYFYDFDENSQLFFLSESCDQKSALVYLFGSEFCSHFWRIEFSNLLFFLDQKSSKVYVHVCTRKKLYSWEEL